MRYFIYLLAIVALIALNFGLFSHLKIFGAAPNLLLLFLIFVSIEKENLDFVYVALLGGLFLDFYNGLPVGGFALGFLLIGFLLQTGISALAIEELRWQKLVFIVCGATVAVSTIVLVYSRGAVLLHLAVFSLSLQVLKVTLVQSLVYNLLLSYPVYLFGIMIQNWILEIEHYSRRRN